jgi:hypothetical protein
MKLLPSRPVVLEDGNVRYRVRIEWEPCPDEGQVSEVRKGELLYAIATTQGLRVCGPIPFQTCKIYYNGVCWVADLEAISDKPNPMSLHGK